MRLGSHRGAGAAVAVAALIVGTGCATSQPASKAGNAKPVRVTERDFRISAPKHVSAGSVRFSVHNKGPANHEFIVIRARERSLPLRADGLTVDEDALEKRTAGALEPGEPGVHELQVRLAPGRYQLLCNMSGHFMAGMHSPLVVES